MFDHIDPLHTKVEKSIQTTLGEIILESPNGFPRNESNLYLVDKHGEIVWRAEKPDPVTLFSRARLNEDGETLSTYTIGGVACDLDLQTGKLVSQTKMQ
jgi:hypothetical protein